MVERCVWDAEAHGSNPCTPTTLLEVLVTLLPLALAADGQRAAHTTARDHWYHAELAEDRVLLLVGEGHAPRLTRDQTVAHLEQHVLGQLEVDVVVQADALQRRLLTGGCAAIHMHGTGIEHAPEQGQGVVERRIVSDCLAQRNRHGIQSGRTASTARDLDGLALHLAVEVVVPALETTVRTREPLLGDLQVGEQCLDVGVGAGQSSCGEVRHDRHLEEQHHGPGAFAVLRREAEHPGLAARGAEIEVTGDEDGRDAREQQHRAASEDGSVGSEQYHKGKEADAPAVGTHHAERRAGDREGSEQDALLELAVIRSLSSVGAQHFAHEAADGASRDQWPSRLAREHNIEQQQRGIEQHHASESEPEYAQLGQSISEW